LKRARTSQVLASVLVNSLFVMRNYPVSLIDTAISPLSFLLLISFVSQGTLIGEGILGALIMSMFGAGMSLQSDLSHLKNDFKLQDMLVSSPTPATVYVVGMSLSEITYNIPALATLAVLGAIYIHPSLWQAVTILAALLLMFLTSVVIGFMLSTISSDVVQSFAFQRLISTLFSTIPPVYYPITYIPEPYRNLAYLSPTTYAAELVQATSGFITLSSQTIMIDWLILAGVTIFLVIFATRKARWREK
jgi:ABC-2 type transport system permease protein